MKEVRKHYDVPGLHWAVYKRENPKSAAQYNPNNKSLVIFANEDLQTYAQVEKDAIHELCHAAMDLPRDRCGRAVRPVQKASRRRINGKCA